MEEAGQSIAADPVREFRIRQMTRDTNRYLIASIMVMFLALSLSIYPLMLLSLAFLYLRRRLRLVILGIRNPANTKYIAFLWGELADDGILAYLWAHQPKLLRDRRIRALFNPAQRAVIEAVVKSLSQKEV